MGVLDKFSLAGKAAFVTGGARGIGQSVGTAFAEAGACIFLWNVLLFTTS